MAKTSGTNHHHIHHHPASSTTMRRGTAHPRPSELISAEALQHVVLPLQRTITQRNPQEQEPLLEKEDPIGDQMTRLLNAHPEFNFATSTSTRTDGGAEEEDEEGFTLVPLLCRRNWLVFKRSYHRLKSVRTIPLLLSIVGFCYESSPNKRKLFQTMDRTLLLFLSLVVAGLSAVLLTSHLALQWTGQAACLLLIQGSMLLLDWKDVQSYLPSQLKWIWKILVCVADWMDRYMCLRKRYSGREWNKKEFEFNDPLAAQSRHAPLWTLPPPCIKDVGRHLCLDSRYMSREEWSQETSKHIVAINFCYLLMREDHMRKQSSKTSEKYKRSPSLPTTLETNNNYDDPIFESTAQAEGEADLNNRQQHHRVLGLSSNSPSGGIELVRDSLNLEQLQRRDSSTLRLSSFASSSNNLIETPTNAQSVRSDDDSTTSTVASCSSAVAADMNWVDISARIGMRVLNNAHLQRVVASEEAAERLKNITDQFVASPNDHHHKTSTDIGKALTIPYEAQSVASSTLQTSGLQRAPHCRPVHSMWTSAAAAANDEDIASDEEESTIASLELGWRESRSYDRDDVQCPTAPPTIIRTRHFPSTSPQREARSGTTSPGRHPNGHNVHQLLDADTQSQEESTFGESQEVLIDPAHFTLHKSCDASLHRRRGRSHSQSQHTTSHISHHVDRKVYERKPLASGIKVAAPFFPMQPGFKRGKVGHSNYQMATVVSSKRIFVGTDGAENGVVSPNCLSVTCKVDKSFLRNGEFAELTFRVMDDWGPKYMPRHSKVPIGACVATTFGTGVVVGWRVEDDCHVVRSLWQRRGAGSAHAYLNRDAIHGVLEAAVGFEVLTKCGSGKVLGYVDAGRRYQDGRYVVSLQDEGVYKNCVVTLNRKDIHACHGAQFIPVLEHIKEACDYQIMLDTYKALVRQQRFNDEDDESADDHLWKFWTENLDTLWKSFLKAVEEDSEFGEGVDNVMGTVIEFLERLDRDPASKETLTKSSDNNAEVGAHNVSNDHRSSMLQSTSEGTEDQDIDAGFWILNDILGGIFPPPDSKKDKSDADTASTDDVSTQVGDVQSEILEVKVDQASNAASYKRAFAVIRTLMRTVSLARAASVGKPQFRLALTICREFLMFARTLIKVQQKNVSPQSLEIWRAAVQEIISTFGPLKERFEKVGRGVAQRMERTGRRAKIRVLRFADSILADEIFLNSLCQGEWKQCLVRIETSLVKAKIADEASCLHYRKTAHFIYDHLLLLSSKESGATARNNEKLANFAKLVQLIAVPKRSLLKLIRSDDVLEILERILVRVFCREEVASRMLTIHASNFKSLRHLRILKDLSVSGRLWIPLLDAADEEFSYVVSRMPENAKEFMCPLSSIFSLCVAQFHKICAGNSTKDWLDFLLEDDGVRIIHELDMKLILALSSFSRDVKETMLVIPYYPSIDDDILNFMDEVELDKLLKELSEAIDDADKLASFIREKAATAIERFLAYLPKLSIPVERRDLGEGWVLTVGQESGGDLTLSDVKVKRENLVCEVMGGDALFLPIFGEDEAEDTLAAPTNGSNTAASDFPGPSDRVESSILDDIREMILQAQRHGSWTVGVGGVGQPSSDPYVASVLQGLPITSVLSCGIDLWRNLEIDDDELLEIAIRDVSYQIQLHKEMEDNDTNDSVQAQSLSKSSVSGIQSSLSGSASFEEAKAHRFNPRVDPTVLLLDMSNMTLHLERFRFRIEKGAKKTIFDPVFEGCGTVSIQNLNILLRVECARERIGKVGSPSVAPVLILRELEVEIEHVRLHVEDTGADWLLNKAVKGFSENITDVVESNLKEQIQEQTKQTLEQLNSYFRVNQDILLNLLGITMEDLEEHIVWV